jgi:hypothetical protein
MERAAVNLPYGCTKGVGRVGCGGRCEPGGGRRPGLGVEAPAVETTQQPTRRRSHRFVSAGSPLRVLGKA